MRAYTRLDSLVDNWIGETRPRFKAEEWVFREGDFLFLRTNKRKLMAIKRDRGGKLSFLLNDDIYLLGEASVTSRMNFIEDKIEKYGKQEGLQACSISFFIVENAGMTMGDIEVLDNNRAIHLYERKTLIEQDGKKLLIGHDGKAFGSFVGSDCKSIKDAFEFLKPSEVIQAEKQNKRVLRQGEYFFVPVPELVDKLGPWTNEKLYPRRDIGGKMMGYRLPSKKDGNVHVVHEGCVYDGKIYARGSVRHHYNPSLLKRENYLEVGIGIHNMIFLDGPHLVVKNKSLGDVVSSLEKLHANFF